MASIQRDYYGITAIYQRELVKSYLLGKRMSIRVWHTFAC